MKEINDERINMRIEHEVKMGILNERELDIKRRELRLDKLGMEIVELKTANQKLKVQIERNACLGDSQGCINAEVLETLERENQELKDKITDLISIIHR